MRCDIFEKSFEITSSELDAQGHCRLSALLGFFQDVGNLHAEQQGMGREDLMAECGAVWMLARAWLRLIRPILQDEILTVRTWHRAAPALRCIGTLICSLTACRRGSRVGLGGGGAGEPKNAPPEEGFLYLAGAGAGDCEGPGGEADPSA